MVAGRRPTAFLHWQMDRTLTHVEISLSSFRPCAMIWSIPPGQLSFVPVRSGDTLQRQIGAGEPPLLQGLPADAPPGIQLVSHFDNADYITFRAVVLQNILATDMARHGEYTAKLKRRGSVDAGGREGR